MHSPKLLGDLLADLTHLVVVLDKVRKHCSCRLNPSGGERGEVNMTILSVDGRGGVTHSSMSSFFVETNSAAIPPTYSRMASST